jgi:hypothetical protein
MLSNIRHELRSYRFEVAHREFEFSPGITNSIEYHLVRGANRIRLRQQHAQSDQAEEDLTVRLGRQPTRRDTPSIVWTWSLSIMHHRECHPSRVVNRLAFPQSFLSRKLQECSGEELAERHKNRGRA